jgi:hypothetical protein
MTIEKEQLKDIIKNGGASLDFTTGKPTKKAGFFVSIKDTEAQLIGATGKPIDELLKEVNDLLKSNTYDPEANAGRVLGFWIKDGVLFVDVSKVIKATKKDFYKVKNEAFINNQYSVYNSIEDKTYNLITPIYTLYNTADLLGKPSADNIANYSRDFYNLQDIADFLGYGSGRGFTELIFSSVEAIPDGYEADRVIIKDCSNFTRDILEDDASLSLEDALKYSRLIEAE